MTSEMTAVAPAEWPVSPGHTTRSVCARRNAIDLRGAFGLTGGEAAPSACVPRVAVVLSSCRAGPLSAGARGVCRRVGEILHRHPKGTPPVIPKAATGRQRPSLECRQVTWRPAPNLAGSPAPAPTNPAVRRARGPRRATGQGHQAGRSLRFSRRDARPRPFGPIRPHPPAAAGEAGDQTIVWLGPWEIWVG
jgi:hypothetical protein